MRILVFDGERDISNYLADLFHEHGYSTLPLCEPSEALEHAEAGIWFDVAFIGISTTATAAADLEGRLGQLMPFCTYVLFGEPEALESAKSLSDAHAYLPTPFAVADLLRIAQAVEAHWINFECEYMERSFLGSPSECLTENNARATAQI